MVYPEIYCARSLVTLFCLLTPILHEFQWCLDTSVTGIKCVHVSWCYYLMFQWCVFFQDCCCVFCLLTFIYSVPLKYVVYRDCYCVCCLLTFIYSVPLKYVVYRDCYCVFCLLTFIYSVPLKYVVYRDCYCVCCLLTFIYSVPLKYVVYRDCYCVFCPSLSPIIYFTYSTRPLTIQIMNVDTVCHHWYI